MSALAQVQLLVDTPLVYRLTLKHQQRDGKQSIVFCDKIAKTPVPEDQGNSHLCKLKVTFTSIIVQVRVVLAIAGYTDVGHDVNHQSVTAAGEASYCCRPGRRLQAAQRQHREANGTLHYVRQKKTVIPSACACCLPTQLS